MHCVDLGESFPTHIYLQNLVSIQPRTSFVKFARSLCTDHQSESLLLFLLLLQIAQAEEQAQAFGVDVTDQTVVVENQVKKLLARDKRLVDRSTATDRKTVMLQRALNETKMDINGTARDVMMQIKALGERSAEDSKATLDAIQSKITGSRLTPTFFSKLLF